MVAHKEVSQLIEKEQGITVLEGEASQRSISSVIDWEKEREEDMKMNSLNEIEDIGLKGTTFKEETKTTQIAEGREETFKIILETTETRENTIITTGAIGFSSNRKKTMNKEKIKIHQEVSPYRIYQNQYPDQTPASRMG